MFSCRARGKAVLQVDGKGYNRGDLCRLGEELSRKVVPEKHLFIWPYSLNLSMGRGADAKFTADFMMQQVMVSEDRLAGRVFDRWFWRRQTFDEPVR